MNRFLWHAVGRCRRNRVSGGLLVLAGLVAFLWLWRGGVPTVRASEFGSPPGINVKGQETLLKDRVTALARDLVGDQLVDVVVNIGYLRRQAEKPGGPEEIKLPGFNNYVEAQGPAPGKIVPEYTRVRQIIVMVADTVQADPSTLEQELRRLGSFDPTMGDWVKVLRIAAPKQGATVAGLEAQASPGKRQAPSRKREPEPLDEARSTTHLIKARTAYFNGDYDGALDQILQSISQNPDNPQAYAMLGSLYYTMNWKALALKYWDKSLELDPGNSELNNLVTQVRSRSRS